jgi:hypothetical protein
MSKQNIIKVSFTVAYKTLRKRRLLKATKLRILMKTVKCLHINCIIWTKTVTLLWDSNRKATKVKVCGATSVGAKMLRFATLPPGHDCTETGTTFIGSEVLREPLAQISHCPCLAWNGIVKNTKHYGGCYCANNAFNNTETFNTKQFRIHHFRKGNCKPREKVKVYSSDIED